MAQIIVRPDWTLPYRLVTSEKAFLNRRQFLRNLGLAGGALSCFATEAGLGTEAPKPAIAAPKDPARRNPEFNPVWRRSNQQIGGSYNSFSDCSITLHSIRILVAR